MTHLPGDAHWSLDKKIPIALIGTLIAQIIVFAIFLTNLDNRVTVVKSDQDKLEARVLIQEQKQQDIGLKIVRVEEQIRINNEILYKIWSKLDNKGN